MEYPQRSEQGWGEKQQYYWGCNHINKEKIKEDLRKMPNGKVMGPYQIPMEVYENNNNNTSQCGSRFRGVWAMEVYERGTK